MNSNKNIVAEYKDKFGDKRRIHQTRHGLKVKREKSTVVLTLNPVVAKLTGQKIKKMREESGLTLAELCLSAGLSSATPKSRMWEIENNVRGEGLRFGTLFAIAIALQVEASDLLPTTKEVLAEADIKSVTNTALQC